MIHDLALFPLREDALDGVGLEEAAHLGLDDFWRGEVEDQRALEVYATDEVRHRIILLENRGMGNQILADSLVIIR